MKMKGFKGFNKGLICRGKQYEENTAFEEDAAKICARGMHFCKTPFDVLDYYPLFNDNGEPNEFAEVEALEETVTDDNKKYCDYAQIGSSGDYAKIGSSGDYAVVMCAGMKNIAKAKKGSWITLSEWKYSNEKGRYVPVCVKTEQVDGERIKEDTFYTLVDGEFQEV